jgi:molybdate transport system ATP-binding protein
VSLEVEVAHRLGAFELDVRFRAGDGLVALFGPSGSGKTTVVNTIAGLIRPQRGRITVNGDPLLDTAAGICVPPHRRRIGYVFQEPRLFPHLSVRHNLLYGRWFSPRAGRHVRFEHVVDLLGIGPLLERRPGRLSGGEKQRVALGRAWLASPRLLLMDEPFSSLDAARKEEILPYVERLRDDGGLPIVYVSHSVAEVARLASQVVLLSGGRVAAAGPVGATLARLDLLPISGRSSASAVLDVRVAGHDEAGGLTRMDSAAGPLWIPETGLPTGTGVRLRVRARDVLLAVEPPVGLSARNVLPATVAEVGALTAPVVDVRLDVAGAALLAQVTRQSVQALDLRPGRPVYAIIKAVAFDHWGGPGVRGAPPADVLDL